MSDMKPKKGRVEEWITYFFFWIIGLLGSWDGYNAFLLKDWRFVSAEDRIDVTAYQRRIDQAVTWLICFHKLRHHSYFHRMYL